MIRDGDVNNKIDALSLSVPIDKTARSIFELLEGKFKLDSTNESESYQLETSNSKDEQPMPIKGRVLFAEGNRESPFNHSLAHLDDSLRKCSDSILSAECEDQFILKSDADSIGQSLLQASAKSAACLEYEGYYERAEAFLDSHGHCIVAPADETKTKKYIRKLSNVQDGEKIDVMSSPTLSKVSSSSLLTRRQNSPQLKPLDGSPIPSRFALSLSKSQSLPVTTAFCDDFRKRSPVASEGQAAIEEEKGIEGNFLDGITFGGAQRKDFLDTPTILTTLQKKKQFERFELSSEKIIEENSPTTPLKIPPRKAS